MPSAAAIMTDRGMLKKEFPEEGTAVLNNGNNNGSRLSPRQPRSPPTAVPRIVCAAQQQSKLANRDRRSPSPSFPEFSSHKQPKLTYNNLSPTSSSRDVEMDLSMRKRNQRSPSQDADSNSPSQSPVSSAQTPQQNPASPVLANPLFLAMCKAQENALRNHLIQVF